MIRVCLPSSPVKLYIIDGVPAAVSDLLSLEHPGEQARQEALRSLAAAVGGPEAEGADEAVGAVAPVVLREVSGSARTLSVHSAIVAVAGYRRVVVAVGEAMDGGEVAAAYDVAWPIVESPPAPPSVAPGTAGAPHGGGATGSAGPLGPAAVRVLALLTHLAGQGSFKSDRADDIAAEACRSLVELGTRSTLDKVVHEDLRDLEVQAVGIADHAPAKADTTDAQEALSRAISGARRVPVEVQRLRAALAGVAAELHRSERERLETWRFGRVKFEQVDPSAPALGTASEVLHLRQAQAHVTAAAASADAVRREAIDALATLRAVAQNLDALLSEAAKDTADAFQVNLTALTAALAGPGLLFALWALDVWDSPVWVAVVAGLITFGLLVFVWYFLNRIRPGQRPGRRDIGFAGVLVVGLVGAGLLLPGAVADPSPNENTEREVREIRRLLETQGRAQAETADELATALRRLSKSMRRVQRRQR